MNQPHCVKCNLTFALSQAQITYKGELYHGDCFVKLIQAKKEAKIVKS